MHPDWSAATAAGVERTFPRLANPDVLVYVYPHVATPLGVGVPGYLTALPLFERVEYALPGERVSSLPPSEWPVWEPGEETARPAPAAPEATADPETDGGGPREE